MSTVLELYTERIWGHSLPVIGVTLYQTVVIHKYVPSQQQKKSLRMLFFFCFFLCVYSPFMGLVREKYIESRLYEAQLQRERPGHYVKKHKTVNLHAVLHHWLAN